MRFETLEISSFGPLRDRQFELDGDIVLVYGPNEAGKSSFRAALETIFFGFKPADRDLHPLAQWDPDDVGTLHLEAHLRLGTDEVQGVERVLLQAAKSRIATGRSAFSGPRRGNNCLQQVAWLSRDVFAALYSLEISQLANLNPNVRADIDELLLPTPTGLPLRPISEVRAELRRDHTELWRPDNRGKPVAKQLRKALAEARAEANEAADAERELRNARTEREERESTLEQLRERKREVDRVHAESPLLGASFEHARRKQALGPAPDLRPLGEYPLAKPSQLREEIAELERRLQVPRSRTEQPELELDHQQIALLEAAAEIDHALAQHPSSDADRERRAEHIDAVRRFRNRAVEELDSISTVDVSDAALEQAGAIPFEALRAASLRWSEEREQFAASAGSRAGKIRNWALAFGFAGLVGVALGVFGSSLGGLASSWVADWGSEGGWNGGGDSPLRNFGLLTDPRLAPLGALLLFASLITALFVRPAHRVAPPQTPAELAGLLEPLHLAPAIVDNPSGLERILTILESTGRHLSDARDARQLADELSESIDARESNWRALCARLQLETDGEADLLIRRLGSALASARERRARVIEDTAQRDEALRLCEREAPLLARKREHLERVESALSSTAAALGTASEGPLFEGPLFETPPELDGVFERLVERREEEAFLRRREKELQADPRFAALRDDPRAHAQTPDASWLPAAVAAREQEIAALDDQLGRELRRLGELDELLGSDTGSGFARATDRVREIESDLVTVERDRDRLALLESVLVRAEREFREQHQPDVLRRASLYLDRVTRGRYCRIDVLDDADGHLWVTPSGRSQPVEVGEPLSQGTLDQIFLCLRLGLLDHLDEDRERLPLVLDDALVRMDDDRRQAVYMLLSEISPQRQIFMLTCHRAMAEEISGALKVIRIAL